MTQSNKLIKQTAEIIRILGHPTRIEILILLKNKLKKTLTVTQMDKK